MAVVREEIIQAKMAELRLANEIKQIEKEAALRLEDEARQQERELWEKEKQILIEEINKLSKLHLLTRIQQEFKRRKCYRDKMFNPCIQWTKEYKLLLDEFNKRQYGGRRVMIGQLNKEAYGIWSREFGSLYKEERCRSGIYTLEELRLKGDI